MCPDGITVAEPSRLSELPRRWCTAAGVGHRTAEDVDALDRGVRHAEGSRSELHRAGGWACGVPGLVVCPWASNVSVSPVL